MELEDVVRRRRMVRDFEDRPLPPGVVDRVVGSTLRGPSAGFTQGTELLVLEDAADRARFWDAVVEGTYRERMPWPGLLRAPLVVVVMANEQAYVRRYREPDKDRSGQRPPSRRPGAGDPQFRVPWWIVDASFSAMLALLTATDEGLGALFFDVRRPAELRSAFGVPDDFEPLGAMAIGHPRAHRASPSLARGRRPPTELVHRGRW